MNDWQNELAESHRQQMVDDIRQIRLEKIAMQSRVYRPRLFARTMFNFANWMISTGKQLRRRYELPSVKCNNTESFAH